MVVELPWTAGFRRWNSAPASLILFKMLGREVVQRHSDLTNVKRPQQSKAPCQWVILLGCLQTGSWHCWPAINLKLWELRVKTQEMQKPSSPRFRSSENPQHLAHVWSQERYDLPWQPALLRALAGWLHVTQGKHSARIC